MHLTHANTKEVNAHYMCSTYCASYTYQNKGMVYAQYDVFAHQLKLKPAPAQPASPPSPPAAASPARPSTASSRPSTAPFAGSFGGGARDAALSATPIADAAAAAHIADGYERGVTPAPNGPPVRHTELEPRTSRQGPIPGRSAAHTCEPRLGQAPLPEICWGAPLEPELFDYLRPTSPRQVSRLAFTLPLSLPEANLPVQGSLSRLSLTKSTSAIPQPQP